LAQNSCTDPSVDVHYSFSPENDFPGLPVRLEEGIYRIAQEALANACKHAMAQHIDVTLTVEDRYLHFMVQDDGRGFDPDGVTGMSRILLADDHPIVREGLRAVLETQTDFQVIAEAARGDEALRLALALQPDVLLLDLEMPILDGVETIRRLRQQQPAARIIVFTAFDNDERIIHAVQAGANGYLLKGAPREEIFKAIRITMEGGSLLQPVVASK